jgi:lysine-N-methylase
MPLPIRHLPVLQNWDCHVCGECCKSYPIAITDEECQRIESQRWQEDPAFKDVALFQTKGSWWRPQRQLNRRADGSCVFLSEQGRCRIHERFGSAAKPLPCRLYPFILLPAGDHWRVGMRFACPSAAANKGRALPAHEEQLKEFAEELLTRDSERGKRNEAAIPPPPLQPGQRVTWDDLQRFVQALQKLLGDERDRMERRLRKCLALATLCRQARFEQVTGRRLDEFLEVVASSLESEVPANPEQLAPPSWIGRILFRQALALYARKDQGIHRGLAAKGRVALLVAAWHFARGKGKVPRLNSLLPETTFEQVEAARGPLPPGSEQTLQRYYLTKVASLQFFGPGYFDASLWEGLEALAVTFPAILWLSRAFATTSGQEAVAQAIGVVDDHFGFNLVLSTLRQRLSFRILARTGELSRLIAWYGR